MFKKIPSQKLKFLLPVWLVLAILGNIGTCYLLELSGSETFLSSLFIKIIFCLLNAALLFCTCIQWMEIKDKKHRIRRIAYSYGFAFLLALSYVLGYQLKVDGMTALGVKGKLFILFISMALGIAFTSLPNLWFMLMDRVKSKRNTELRTFDKKSCTKFFWISFGIIFVSWIPAFLAYYPAIMSYDFHRQMVEAYGGHMNTHHPLIHTGLIRLFYLLGVEIGSYEIAMSLFSILQMLVLAACFAYSCVMLNRLTGKKWPCWLSTAVFALLPIHPVLALSMTKDIFFTAFFLLMVTLMLEYRMSGTKKMRIILFIAMLLTGILMLMFRNNAAYAFVIFSIFYIIFSQKQRLLLLILCILIVVGGHSGKAILQDVTGASSGSKIEMVSVMLQQMNRTGHNHMGYHTQEQYDILSYYIPERCWPKYNPIIADGVKHNVGLHDFDNWTNDIPQTIKDWITIGLAYPNDYLDAFLHLTLGYWFIDDMTHAEVLGYGVDSNLGLLYTFNASTSQYFDGIESHSYLPGVLLWYSKVVNANEYQYWPIISLLFKPSFYVWTMVLCIMSVFYLKEKNKMILILFPFIYFLTLLLGPVVNFRYIYPIVAVIPLFLAWVFSPKDWKNSYIALPKSKKK
ncbi:MAG: hypothetical protein IJ397_00615 [Lachnospiraceae bacterium]|nr:hypothetical protein [Lachnospiraceae bacterium]